MMRILGTLERKIIDDERPGVFEPSDEKYQPKSPSYQSKKSIINFVMYHAQILSQCISSGLVSYRDRIERIEPFVHIRIIALCKLANIVLGKSFTYGESCKRLVEMRFAFGEDEEHELRKQTEQKWHTLDEKLRETA